MASSPTMFVELLIPSSSPVPVKPSPLPPIPANKTTKDVDDDDDNDDNDWIDLGEFPPKPKQKQSLQIDDDISTNTTTTTTQPSFTTFPLGTNLRADQIWILCKEKLSEFVLLNKSILVGQQYFHDTSTWGLAIVQDNKSDKEWETVWTIKELQMALDILTHAAAAAATSQQRKDNIIRLALVWGSETTRTLSKKVSFHLHRDVFTFIPGESAANPLPSPPKQSTTEPFRLAQDSHVFVPTVEDGTPLVLNHKQFKLSRDNEPFVLARDVAPSV